MRHKKPVASAISSTRKDVQSCKRLTFRAGPSLINMLQCGTGEETKTTVYIQKQEQLGCKTAISKKCLQNTEASGAYHLREFCGGGNKEPNDTLKTSNAVSQQHHSRQEQYPTCFQRMLARSRKPLERRRRRNKPASIMSSRITSLASRLT